MNVTVKKYGNVSYVKNISLVMITIQTLLLKQADVVMHVILIK